MIRSLFDKGREETSQDAVAQRGQDLATAAAESERGIGERTQTSLSPTASAQAAAEARLVSHELLVRLRSYLRLRALVIAYLRVQARRDWLALRLTNLQKAGGEPDDDFWENLQGEFSGMGLRSEFPSRLLVGEDAVELFVGLVDEFDERYASVAAAAEAALNRDQSAQPMKEARQHVSRMLRIGRTVAQKCQEEAYTLLDELYETVTEIFAGEGKQGTEDRDKDIGRPVTDLKPPAGSREEELYERQKQVSGTGTGPEVTGHLFSRSKGAQ
ncbi:MAG TPA: hypothetical protein VGQ15_15205 [Gaiellaceae bacterium]|jgi:hypothetical protein|nr:hypothetical protein [Gaiellaceae bacterium]